MSQAAAARVLTETGAGRRLALAEALLTTILWGSSYIIVKLALRELGPLTITALRYFLGGLLLLPFAAAGLKRRQVSLRGWWKWLALAGLLSYTLGNGAMGCALTMLEATTTSFLNSSIPVFVLIGSLLWLRESPSMWQAAGVVASMGGAALYFLPQRASFHPTGVAIMMAGVAAYAGSSLVSRYIARSRQVPTLALTALPLVIGGGALLPGALAAEGLPRFGLAAGLLIGLLVLVNTITAYLLFNHAYRVLTAVQMNVVLNLMPFVTALLAWWTLGERLTGLQFAAMGVMVISVLLVQAGRTPQQAAAGTRLSLRRSNVQPRKDIPG
jgi:drug/metabolite transporter (DMT)-like permease